MKKKILFVFFMTLILLSAFAVASSAAQITYSADFGTITTVDNMPTIDGIDTGARVVLKNSDGTYTTYPTYYIMKNSTTFGTSYANLNANNTLGQTYSDESMILIEIPDGVTGISANLFGMDSTNHPTKNLEKIVILSDDYTRIGEQTFRRMPTVKSVTISSSVTEIFSWAFCGSTALQEVIFEEGSLLETTGNSFSGCTALSSINLEACTNLKVLGGSLFNGCTSLRKIALPDSVETIGGQAFYRIGEFELASDYLPKNLKKITSHFLSGCTVKNEVIYFPEGFTDFSGSYHFNDGFYPATETTLVFLGKMTNINLSNVALTYFTENGTKQPLKVVLAQNTYDELNGDFVQGIDYSGKHAYIATTGAYTTKTSGTLTLLLQSNNPNSDTNLGTDENGDKIYSAERAPATIIFCGGDEVEYCYSVRNNLTYGSWYRFFTTERTYDIDAHKTLGIHYNSRVLQAGNCGYDEIATNTCVICDEQSVAVLTPATGLHTCTDDFNCESALVCEVCEKTVREALSHNLITLIDYATGYANEGAKTVTCKNEGCTVCNTSETAKALFSCLGYSAPESGIGGIAIGYTVNNKAIVEYTKATGKTLKYGLFAVSKDKLGDNDVFAKDGTVAEGAINAEVTNYQFAAFELKIAGFTDEQKDTKLAMGAYVVTTDDEATEYSYMQDNTKGEKAGNYYFVSYNNIVG